MPLWRFRVAISLQSWARMARRRFARCRCGPVDEDCVIASGLKAGERVIVEGAQKVKSGRPVAARQWTPPVEKRRCADHRTDACRNKGGQIDRQASFCVD